MSQPQGQYVGISQKLYSDYQPFYEESVRRSQIRQSGLASNTTSYSQLGGAYKMNSSEAVASYSSPTGYQSAQEKIKRSAGINSPVQAYKYSSNYISNTLNDNNSHQFVSYLSKSYNPSGQALLTPIRVNNPSLLNTSNVRILTPNRSPHACKIVFTGGSPTRQQIQQEVDVVHMQALSQSQINQHSIDQLKDSINFLSLNGSTPEKRHTAKSLICALNGPKF